MYEKYNITEFRVFAFASYTNCTTVVLWLLNKYNEKLYYIHAFNNAFRNNNIYLADAIILRLTKQDIHFSSKLNTACINGNYEIINWILNKYPEIILTHIEVNHAIIYGHINIAKMYIKHYPLIDIYQSILICDLEFENIEYDI